MKITLKDIRKALEFTESELVDELSDKELRKATFDNDLQLDSLDFQSMTMDLQFNCPVLIPDDVKGSDTVEEFIKKVNDANKD